jgi:tetratricopeptide (TPR) repeat protein
MRSGRIQLFLILSLLLIICSHIDFNQVRAQQDDWREIEPGEMYDCSVEIESGETIQYSVLVDAPQTYQIRVLIGDANAILEWWYSENSTLIAYEDWAITGEISTYEMQAPYSEEWHVVFYNTNPTESANINAEVHIGSYTIIIPPFAGAPQSSMLDFLFVFGPVIFLVVGVYLVYTRRKSIPKVIDADLGKGIQLLSVGQYRDAEMTFRAIVEKDSESAVGWRYLGDVLVLGGDIFNARKAHETAVRLNPSYSYSSTIESKTKVSGELWTESTTTMDLTMKVQSLTKPFSIGQLGASQEMLETVLEEQMKKLKENPENTEIKKDMASTLLSLGRHRESARLYGNILAESPEDWDVHDSLLMALSGAKYRY